ncbi:MAG: glycoside hydrolase family 127 protein [Gammaproteobacteria bacterium]|nr:glycoside hydrolase family 127 protein [Gammaproteobacteria bacterium]
MDAKNKSAPPVMKNSLAARVGRWARVRTESMGWGATVPADIRTHLDAAIAWLQRAQDVTADDGVAQTYLVKYAHWANSYPETTGYIIPTFYDYAALTGDQEARARARRMTDWECEIQLPDGGVLAGAIGDSDQPTVFNTGQVLFGWVRAFQEEGDERYREAAARAAHWLCEAQDDDGCWRRFGSPMTTRNVNLYNTRSAWGIAAVHRITGEQRFLDGAVKNLEWALAQQRDNGWYAHNCLQDDTQPFVHTIAYAMRGFLEVGDYTGREDFLASAVKVGDALAAALPANGFLPGRFDREWRPTVKWSCLTGNAQIAINWGRLYQITGEERFREAVTRINGFTKTTQTLDGPLDERGGIKGSHPINGGYHPWQYPNWAAKFFADALMMEHAIAPAHGN